MPLDTALVLMTEGDGSIETDVLVARFFFGVTRGLSAVAAAALARNAAAPDIPFEVLSGVRGPLLPARGDLSCLACAGGAGAALLRRAGLPVFARASAAGAGAATPAALWFSGALVCWW